MLAGGAAFAQTEQAVGEFAAIIGQHRADPQRAGPFQIAQKPARVGGGPGVVDAHERPTGGPPLGDALHHLPGNGSNCSAGTDAGSALAWITARTFGVAIAIALGPMADNGSIVKMDQHGRTPFQISLRTDLAMKNAERRGDMRSSGMGQIGKAVKADM